MFDQFPDSALVHPASSPDALVRRLSEVDAIYAVEAAHLCLKKRCWSHLEAMVENGFDIARCHTVGTGEAKVEETLLHRNIRLHMYDELAESIEKLVSLGADPHAYNAQGISVLGLLCATSRDLPSHRTIQALEALERAGVTVLDPCGNESWWSQKLLEGQTAAQIISKHCPEIMPWVEERMLALSTAQATGKRQPPRL